MKRLVGVVSNEVLEILKERSKKSEGKLVDQQQQQQGEEIREKKRVG